MASAAEATKNISEKASSGKLPDIVKNPESLIHASKKFSARREELFTALTSSDFYIQLLFVGIALAIAWLMAVLIQRRVKTHFDKHPPKKIDVEFITKPLKLLAPLLGILYLSAVKPFADEFAAEGDLTDAVIKLCSAYFVAKTVVLIIESRIVAYFVAFVIMAVAVLNVTGFAAFTVVYLNSMGFDIGQFHISLLALFHGIFMLVVVFWIAGLLSRTLESYLRRSSSLSYMARELSVKFFRIFVYFLAFMITLSALGVDLTAFAVFGGALGVGVGLGLQKITANFVSGIILLMEKSIKIGDLIEIAGSSGWVRQLNIRYALIETGEGKEILIPNEELISTRVINWSHSSDAARVDIKITVAYESNALKVRDMLINTARAHPLCQKNPAPNCWLREFSDTGLQFLLIFWIPDVHEGRMGPQSDVMLAILERFRKEGIIIPAVAPTVIKSPLV